MERILFLVVVPAAALKVPLERSHGNVTDFVTAWPETPWPSRWRTLLTAGEKVSEEQLMNFGNLLYTGYLGIGVPPQEVRLVFDTGSADLWVSQEAFRRSESMTWHDTTYHVSLIYGKGEAAGYYGLDTACLNSDPQLCVERQPILLATELEEIEESQMDGIVGLGFIGISHVHKTFLRNLNASFRDLSFGFDLRALPSPSAVFFGSHDQVVEEGYRLTGVPKEKVLTSQVVDIFMIPGMGELQAGWWLLDIKAKVIGQPNLWSVRYHSFFYYSNIAISSMLCMWIARAGCRYCSKTGSCLCDCFVSTLWCWCFFVGLSFFLIFLYLSCTMGVFRKQPIYAALDTGSSLISMPPGDFYGVAVAMWGDHFFTDCKVLGGNLLCYCDIASKGRPLELDFGGKTMQLTGEEMFEYAGKGPTGRHICLAGMAYNLQPVWILGDVFLRQAFVVHDYARQAVSIFPHRPTPEAQLLDEAPWRLWHLWPLPLAAALSVAVRIRPTELSEPLLGSEAPLRPDTV